MSTGRWKVMCLYPNMHIRVSACVLVALFLINGALTTAFRNWPSPLLVHSEKNKHANTVIIERTLTATPLHKGVQQVNTEVSSIRHLCYIFSMLKPKGRCETSDVTLEMQHRPTGPHHTWTTGTDKQKRENTEPGAVKRGELWKEASPSKPLPPASSSGTKKKSFPRRSDKNNTNQ